MNKQYDDDIYQDSSKPVALVLPPGDTLEPFKIYIVWKLIRDNPAEEFKIAATMNVMVPGMKRYFDMTDILALHQTIKSQIGSKPNVVLEFLFHNN